MRFGVGGCQGLSWLSDFWLSDFDGGCANGVLQMRVGEGIRRELSLL